MSEVMKESILVPLFVFTMAVLIVWLKARQAQIQSGIRAESQKHLIDRFSSGKEFSEFLESEGGKRFLEEMTAKRVDPAGRTLNLVRTGVVLSVLGLGFLVLMVKEAELIYPGVIVLTLGIGFLIAAVVSIRLAKRWGVGGSGPDLQGPGRV